MAFSILFSEQLKTLKIDVLGGLRYFLYFDLHLWPILEKDLNFSLVRRWVPCFLAVKYYLLSLSVPHVKPHQSLALALLSLKPVRSKCWRQESKFMSSKCWCPPPPPPPISSHVTFCFILLLKGVWDNPFLFSYFLFEQICWLWWLGRQPRGHRRNWPAGNSLSHCQTGLRWCGG